MKIAMPYVEFKNQLTETLELKSTLADAVPFSDIPDWDSLMVLGIISFADKEFSRKLSLAQIRDHNTAQSLYALLTS